MEKSVRHFIIKSSCQYCVAGRNAARCTYVARAVTLRLLETDSLQSPLLPTKDRSVFMTAHPSSREIQSSADTQSTSLHTFYDALFVLVTLMQ